MAFQSVNIQLTEPRSFVDLPHPMRMGVEQILSWCKGNWWHRYTYFVICTDIPMAQMSPFCGLHGYAMVCMGIPMSWPAWMSPYHDLTAFQSLSDSRLASPAHQGDLALRALADVKFKSSSKQLTFACGKGTNGFLENNIHWHLYHSESYHFLM